MPIVTNDLKFKYPKTVSDGDGNGGRVSQNNIISGAIQNVFPHVFEADRLAGLITWRKVFPFQTSDGLELYYAKFRLFEPTAGDDHILFGVGTQRDTQLSKAITRYFGTGWLYADVSSGGQTIEIVVSDAEMKSGTYAFVAVDDKIVITDKTTYDAAGGNIQELTVDTVTPHATENRVTITTVEQLAYSFTVAAKTKISSVYEHGSVIAGYDTFVVTTVGDGDYDDSAETGYPIETPNDGSREIDVTLTWTDATHATVTDDESTNWGTWDTTAGDFSALDGTTLVFKIFQAGLSGTWASGDTITFTLHPAAAPIWERRKVPENCGSLANNKTTLVYSGQSA